MAACAKADSIIAAWGWDSGVSKWVSRLIAGIACCRVRGSKRRWPACRRPWCGPCVAEHREFQKLYDKLKDRSDVSVLSFNVDENLGSVAPYMAEHKYTFPAIPAKEVVDAVVPEAALPRNWFVSPKGKIEWEQIGFGSDPMWGETMLAKLEEVARAK
jgi:hypothetical protein